MKSTNIFMPITVKGAVEFCIWESQSYPYNESEGRNQSRNTFENPWLMDMMAAVSN